MSLCTAPVQPLPANTTLSLSEAFTALRMISLGEEGGGGGGGAEGSGGEGGGGGGRRGSL